MLTETEKPALIRSLYYETCDKLYVDLVGI
jgi:hypothetical protein